MLYLAAAAITMADIPAEYKWATKCDYENNDWKKYHRFHELAKHNESRDQCLVISTHLFTVADNNDDFKLSKCEHQFGCLAVISEDGQTEKQKFENAKKCAVAITKSHKKGPVTLRTLAELCAEKFPTLEGSPLHHE